MKVIFMGTPAFAVPCLAELITAHEVLAVVTQPDKQKGRGRKQTASPVKELALRHQIPVLQPASAREDGFCEELRTYVPDVIVVAAYGRKLPERILSLPPYGCLNVHGSLLPKYRGAAPVQWAVIHGETETGVTIMQMAKGIDTGDMLLQKKTPILPEEVFGDVYEKLSRLGAQALLEVLSLLEKGVLRPEIQDEALATYAPMITREMENICWDKPKREIVNLVRGLNPEPGAYTSLNGVQLKVWKASALEDAAGTREGKPGQVMGLDKGRGLLVACADGIVSIEELQPQNGKRMEAAAYARGHRDILGNA